MTRRILTLGVFDVFHVGHLRYLQHAAQVPGTLVVAVTRDAIVRETKGKWPVVGEQERLAVIQSVRGVGEAMLSPSSTAYTEEAVSYMREWGIDHLVAGGCWQGTQRFHQLEEALAKYNITVSFAEYTQELSTTLLCQRLQQAPALYSQYALAPDVSHNDLLTIPVAQERHHSQHRVLALGAFDLLHAGHARFLEQAAQLGDHLTVGVAPDHLVLANKNRPPVFTTQQRLALVASLACVNAVVAVDHPMRDTHAAAAWILGQSVGTVACGGEWQGSAHWQRLEAQLALHGVNVVYLPPTPGISSSAIRQRMAQLEAERGPSHASDHVSAMASD